MTAQSRKRIGVLLCNTGTPSAPEPKEVRRYLSKFLMDKRIAPMNRFCWWFILNLFILPKRGVTSAQKYRQIWTPEGSPFILTHEALAQALEARFAGEGRDVLVRFAMSYSEPSVQNTFQELNSLGCERFVVLPLYPQSAYSTVMSVKDSVERAKKKLRLTQQVDIIEGYAEHPSYIKALAASIINAGFGDEEGDKIVFSYHSIPLVDIENGDTYELQVGSTSLHLAGELGLDRKSWTIGYQCRFDKERTWLSPFTKDIVCRWAENSDGRSFVVCPIFPADCLETIFDVDIEMRNDYQRKLVQTGKGEDPSRFVYVPCLGKSRAHVRVLADVVEPYLQDFGEAKKAARSSTGE